MSRPSPTPFEIDMAMCGLQAGVHPIPKQVTSRPDAGEYGGMYDEKKVALPPTKPPPEPPKPAPESAKVEEKVSAPEDPADTKKGNYKTRDAKPEGSK